MKIKLKNIGIVENSTIELNGLTVIVGRNNSGKTTVGKALYSVVESVSNIEERIRNDSIQVSLDKLQETKKIFGMSFRSILRFQASFKNEFLKNYFSMGIGHVVINTHINEFIGETVNALENFDPFDEGQSNLKQLSYEIDDLKRYLETSFDADRKTVCEVLNKLLVDLRSLDMRTYMLTAVGTKLAVEFFGQIQPAANPDVESEIEISAGGNPCCRLFISKNKVLQEKKTFLEKMPYDNALFLDNAYAFDEPPYGTQHRYIEDESTIFNENRVLTHSNDTKFYLGSMLRRNNLEKTLNETKYKAIKEKINEIVPGSFDIVDNEHYYVNEGVRLKAGNLATGSKFFAILKTFLESGMITENTLLVLDEPEAHLHPEWQNFFVTLVALLVKDVGCHVLLTTHSPNFMMAVDACMRKYKITEKTNFYKANSNENGLVRYDCVNENLDVIYQDFVQYLSEMKVVRDSYLNGETD